MSFNTALSWALKYFRKKDLAKNVPYFHIYPGISSAVFNKVHHTLVIFE